MGARGEGTLTVNGETVAILFTNRALARIETELGKTVLEIANQARESRFGINDTARLMMAGMDAARRDGNEVGKPVTIDDALNVMDQVGFVECAKVVMEALAAVLWYEDKEPDSPPV